MIINQEKMALHLASRTALTQREARKFMRLFFMNIVDTLVAHERVSIYGFGAFELVYGRRRWVATFGEGENTKIRVTFRPCEAWRERMARAQPKRFEHVRYLKAAERENKLPFTPTMSKKAAAVTENLPTCKNKKTR